MMDAGFACLHLPFLALLLFGGSLLSLGCCFIQTCIPWEGGAGPEFQSLSRDGMEAGKSRGCEQGYPTSTTHPQQSLDGC